MLHAHRTYMDVIDRAWVGFVFAGFLFLALVPYLTNARIEAAYCEGACASDGHVGEIADDGVCECSPAGDRKIRNVRVRRPVGTP